MVNCASLVPGCRIVDPGIELLATGWHGAPQERAEDEHPTKQSLHNIRLTGLGTDCRLRRDAGDAAWNGKSHATFLRRDRIGYGGRCARNDDGEGNDEGNTGRPDRDYRSDGRERHGDQGAGQVEHRRLQASVAVATSGGFRFGLVVMEQTSQESKNEDRNYRKRNGREPARTAPFRVTCRQIFQYASIFKLSGRCR